MGFSTAIYAVDLDKLAAAVGSGDARLVKRLLPPGKAKRRRRTKDGPRIMVDRKSAIYLNGQPVSFDELAAELRRPKWKWSRVFYYETPPPRTGRWRGDFSAYKALNDALPERGYVDWVWCYSLKEFKSGDTGDEDDEMSAEEAAADLVEGGVLRARYGSEYGYGLELLCKTLGTLVAGIEGKGGMLHALRLKTPLSKDRSPVKLPKGRDDFPLIGYLTEAEVAKEVKRLEGMDLSYPKDELIESDRKELLGALQKAAKKKLGVVAFYH